MEKRKSQETSLLHYNFTPGKKWQENSSCHREKLLVILSNGLDGLVKPQLCTEGQSKHVQDMAFKTKLRLLWHDLPAKPSNLVNKNAYSQIVVIARKVLPN
jgi:hypothetical protein